jgi:anaphase-promoting complex subunit 5
MRKHVQECEAFSITMEKLLRSLWHSEFLFKMHHYRVAVILLADVGLDFGLSKRSRKMVEDLMPQIITGGDLEQRAFAAFTLARCIIAGEQASKAALQEAVLWLAIAEKDYMALEIYRSAMDVQYLLAVVYDTLGAEQERDAASQRYESTQQTLLDLEVAVVDEEVGEILDMISRIGALEL